uniref:Des-Arg9-[Ala1,Thr6]-bradykinin n=1 Tax=Physalaemus signifer TaxID=364768 RepID=BRK1_PHYSG|nr:RecName: Full=Des-Arg9-[Ala1,Thr6]-bradykinin; Short=Des-Arg-[Ala1,Thr6]-bradykinin [Physalaemus signifer]
APPGFTPF